jgi:hypothetical protein
MSSWPPARAWAIRSVIQSAACSMVITTLLASAGLCGPATMKKFGKPAVSRPR